MNKHIGATRFIYNLALETKQMAWVGYKVNLSCFDLIKQLPELKKECEWLREVNSQSLQFPIRNLDNAFTRFFKGQSKYPNFKKKGGFGSFNIQQSINIKDGKLTIPKFKEGIEIILHRPLKGNIRQATITRTPTGKYFASILCETGESIKPKEQVLEDETIGIDLGIKTFIVVSNGKRYDNQNFYEKHNLNLNTYNANILNIKTKRLSKVSFNHEKSS